MGRFREKMYAHTYKHFTDDNLFKSSLVQRGVLSERQAATEFGISNSTIHRKKNDKNFKPVGRPCVLLEREILCCLKD